MNRLYIFGLHVNYKYNPRLKNSYINILPSAEVVVKTPINSERYIYDLIEKKYEWIVKNINNIKKYQKVEVSLEDEVLIFGEVYSIDHEIATYLRDKLSKIKNSTQENIANAYDSYYKKIASEHIPKRVEHFSAKMGLQPTQIKYRKMKRRWGSCDSKRELTFNIYLLKLSSELIDYVIVHELSHLKHMNHSKHFHALVKSHLPDAKELEQKIKEQYHRFMLK